MKSPFSFLIVRTFSFLTFLPRCFENVPLTHRSVYRQIQLTSEEASHGVARCQIESVLFCSCRVFSTAVGGEIGISAFSFIDFFPRVILGC